MRQGIGFVFLNSQRSLRSGWWLAIFLVLLAAMLVPAQIVAQRQGVLVSIPEQVAMLLVATWLCQVLRKRPFVEVTGRFDLRWPAQWAAGAAVGAGLMLVPALFLLAGGWVRFAPGSVAGLGDGLLLMAGVAIVEELLFRGFLFQRLIDGIGPWPAQIVVGVFFLLTHLENPGMTGSAAYWAQANIFLASLLFGLAYLRTTSLAMPIGLHFAANVMEGVVLGFGVSGTSESGLLLPMLHGPAWLTGGAFGLEASAPGLIAVVSAIALLAWRRTSRLAARSG